jgi:hypothetical protein
LITQALTTTAASISLTPRLFGGSRLATFADLYQEFRFRRISIKMHPATTSAGVKSDYVISYAKTLTTAAPSTLLDAYQLPSSRLSAQTDTIPQNYKIPM